jgi:hypothetical protein
MKPTENYKTVLVATFASLAILASTRGQLVFDNMSIFESGSASAGVTATSSTPNTWMGDAYNLAGGATAITGFDIYPVNLSGTAFNALKITIDVWGSVNLGTVNATTPAFGNLLGSYVFTSSGTFNSGFYYNFEGSPNGVNPGVTISPLSIPSTQIGLSFNYMGSTDGGVTFFSTNSLTSLISYSNAVSVGSEVFNGYYRNANSEANGNFTSSLRSLGLQGQSLAVRIYSVPEPTTVAFAVIGSAALLVFRRRK